MDRMLSVHGLSEDIKKFHGLIRILEATVDTPADSPLSAPSILETSAIKRSSIIVFNVKKIVY